MVDWDNFGMAMKKLSPVYQTNVVKMAHDWGYESYQQDLFSNPEAASTYPVGRGNIENHQNYISCFAPPYDTQETPMRGVCYTDAKKDKDCPTYCSGNIIWSEKCHGGTVSLPRCYPYTTSSIDHTIYTTWKHHISIG